MNEPTPEENNLAENSWNSLSPRSSDDDHLTAPFHIKDEIEFHRDTMHIPESSDQRPYAPSKPDIAFSNDLNDMPLSTFHDVSPRCTTDNDSDDVSVNNTNVHNSEENWEDSKTLQRTVISTNHVNVLNSEKVQETSTLPYEIQNCEESESATSPYPQDNVFATLISPDANEMNKSIDGNQRKSEETNNSSGAPFLSYNYWNGEGTSTFQPDISLLQCIADYRNSSKAKLGYLEKQCMEKDNEIGRMFHHIKELDKQVASLQRTKIELMKYADDVKIYYKARIEEIKRSIPNSLQASDSDFKTANCENDHEQANAANEKLKMTDMNRRSNLPQTHDSQNSINRKRPHPDTNNDHDNYRDVAEISGKPRLIMKINKSLITSNKTDGKRAVDCYFE
ncbi:unnamed protein product [Caenorhabditis bovis]|uniref:Uncharacterized protein n=1 Tax=Caenorhabditis bovis TaxID=2654633 RepID=A0A8S1ES88_9PELO|nr:unnamed protein product [Caenorhabditis bovis]